MRLKSKYPKMRESEMYRRAQHQYRPMNDEKKYDTDYDSFFDFYENSHHCVQISDNEVGEHKESKNVIELKSLETSPVCLKNFPTDIQYHILGSLDVHSAIQLALSSKTSYKIVSAHAGGKERLEDLTAWAFNFENLMQLSELIELINKNIEDAVYNPCVKKSTWARMAAMVGCLIPGPIVLGVNAIYENASDILYNSAVYLVSSFKDQTNTVFQAILASCPKLNNPNSWDSMDGYCGNINYGRIFKFCSQITTIGCDQGTRLMCDEQYVPLCASFYDAVKAKEEFNQHDSRKYIGLGMFAIFEGVVAIAIIHGYRQRITQYLDAIAEKSLLKKQLKKVIRSEELLDRIVEQLKAEHITAETSALIVKELLESYLQNAQEKEERIINNSPLTELCDLPQPMNHLGKTPISLFFSSPKKDFESLLKESSGGNPLLPKWMVSP